MIIPPLEDNSGDWQKAAIRFINKFRINFNNTNFSSTLMKGHDRGNKICIMTDGNLSGSPFLENKKKKW